MPGYINILVIFDTFIVLNMNSWFYGRIVFVVGITSLTRERFYVDQRKSQHG